MIDWNDAKIHVLAHVPAMAVRCLKASAAMRPRRSARFSASRARAPLARFAKIYRIEIPYSIDQLSAAMIDIVRVISWILPYIPAAGDPRLRRSRCAAQQGHPH